MTIANALKGTRMGRPVKTEAEVLEEFRDYKAPEGSGLAGRIGRLPNGNFLFFDVPYQGRALPCIERPMQLLDNGKEKSLAEHLAWLLEPQNNMAEFTIADMELEFQLARISFELCDAAQFGDLARQYIEGTRTLYSRKLFTADRFDYFPGRMGGIITNLGKIPSKHKRVIIPSYPSEVYGLSVSRPESELDRISRVDLSTKRFLSAFLGLGADRAGAIFSYLAPCQGPHLRGVRIRTPDLGWRDYHHTSIGGLGVDPKDRGRFAIQAGDVDLCRPVLAVAIRNYPPSEVAK